MEEIKETKREDKSRYPIELFLKYKSGKKLPSELYEFTHERSHNPEMDTLYAKLCPSNVFKNSEIRANLNFLINKRSMTSVDETLYSQIQKYLNKMSAKNFNETVDEIMGLHFTKAKHIYKLAESIILKSIEEGSYLELYARLSYKLIPCFIEQESIKIQFRTVLLTICQDMFTELTYDPKHDPAGLMPKTRVDYEKSANYTALNLVGLCRFIGELSSHDIVPIPIISFCFDKIMKYLDRTTDITKANQMADSVNALLSTSYNALKIKDSKNFALINEKLNDVLTKDKFLNKKIKFSILEIRDKMSK